jgi:lysozyme
MIAHARLTLFGLFLVLIAGCGGGGGAPEPRAPSGTPIGAAAIAPVPGIPRPFGDADPTDWPGRSPAAYLVHGVDVSRFQGAIDWNRAAGAGVAFAFLKATEGGDRLDPTFRDNWRQTRAAGIPRGAYHFYYFCRPAAEQAAWFIRNVPREAGALPPVLDLEWNPFSPTCTLRPPAETVRAEAEIFLRALTRHYGQRPIMYVPVDFFERNQMWRVQGYEFWLRSTAAHPAATYGGQPWTFWQYTGTGLAPGFRGEVDLNAFNGSAADWQAWLARRRR